jgi:hypothetical protein
VSSPLMDKGTLKGRLAKKTGKSNHWLIPRGHDSSVWSDSLF